MIDKKGEKDFGLYMHTYVFAYIKHEQIMHIKNIFSIWDLVEFDIMHVKLTNNSPPFCQSSIKG